MYKFFVLFHIVTSAIFVLVALAVTVKSVLGWSKELAYSKADRYLAYLFTGLLYLTLVHGIIMYFFIDPSSSSDLDFQKALKRASLRFWVVEHFYVMTFALIISQIGGIFIRKTKIDKNRFAYSSFYYGTATFITIVSMTFYFIYR